MTNWFSEGYDAAEKQLNAGFTKNRSKRRFWVRQGETAVVRFLAAARHSFNYKRVYLSTARGEKYYTSPGHQPDPFVQRGYPLNNAFAWKVIDRRIIEFDVDNNGSVEHKKIGPRVLYIAEGPKFRKPVIALEKMLQDDFNKELEEEGKPLIDFSTPDGYSTYNITHFDIKLQKLDKNWQILAVRGGKPKPLTDEDKKLLEQHDFDLREQVRPLPHDQINAVLSSIGSKEEDSSSVPYAYGDDDTGTQAEEPTFFD